MAGGVRITVDSSRDLVASGSPAGDRSAGAKHLIENIGAVEVDLGDSTVATGAGYPLPPGSAVGVELEAGEELHAITASGTTTLAVLTTGG